MESNDVLFVPFQGSTVVCESTHDARALSLVNGILSNHPTPPLDPTELSHLAAVAHSYGHDGAAARLEDCTTSDGDLPQLEFAAR